MKKFTLFVTLTSCLLMLAGCVETPPNSSDAAETPISGTQLENIELISLRSSIAEKNCMLGVAFLGYVDSESDETTVRGYVTDSTLAKTYPFLENCDPVLLEGAELYAFVPANKDTVVTVYRAEPSEDGNYIDHKDVPLYSGKSGEAVVLRCNISEVHANVLISVTDGKNTLEFHPTISLENGRDLVLGEGCYDFTFNDIRAYSDEAYEYLIENIDEIKDGIKNGMSIRYKGEVFMYNHYTLKYVLGKYDEDGTFDIAREYLIDEYYTLAFYELEENEKTIGWRVVGQGLEYNQEND